MLWTFAGCAGLIALTHWGSWPGWLRTFVHHRSLSGRKQFVDRCRARLHLLGRRREAGSALPVADEPPLPGRRPMPGQDVTHSRMAPPTGSRGQHRIDGRSYPAPDLSHPASRLSVDLLPPMVRQSRRRRETPSAIAHPRTRCQAHSKPGAQARARPTTKCELDRQGTLAQPALPGAASQRQADRLQQPPGHRGAAAVSPGQARDLLGERPPRAVRNRAEEPPHGQVDDHRLPSHRRVVQVPLIAAVHPGSDRPARPAARCPRSHPTPDLHGLRGPLHPLNNHAA